MVLTETGLAKVFQRVKSFVIAQLNSKASVLHTHTYSEIVDLPNGIAVDSTLDGTSSNAIANSAVSNALDGKIPKAGGAVITGTNIGRADNTGCLDICGGTTFENGGFVALRGKDTDITGQEGAVVIGTNNGSSSCDLTLLPNGTATWGNKKIDTIEEQGEGYIRYSNGIQICWGKISRTSSSTKWQTLYETQKSLFTENYPKSFISAPAVTAGSSGEQYCIIESAYGSTTHTPDFYAVRPSDFTNFSFTIDYIAIGRWK